MRLIAMFFGPHAPREQTAQSSVFSHYFKLLERLPKLATSSWGPRLGRERCGKINAVNSGSESWTGIGVVAGFAGAGGLFESSHMKMAALIS